jgi:hypothetical protein
MKAQDRPVLSCCKSSMTNTNAIKLLSPRTRSLLRLHAEAIGVDEANLASDLFEMMVRDAQSLQLQAATESVSRDKRDRFSVVVAAKLNAELVD